MRAVFWLSFAGILYTYAGYPLIMWLLAKLSPRKWKAAPINPSVSVIIAVHNGADLLAERIENLASLDYEELREIIIVSDGSTDATNELLSQESDPRVKAIILDEHGGKAVALNAGIAASSSEILLFVDIRPMIPPGSVRQLVSNFADPAVGCVAGELTLRQDGHDVAASAVSGLYWRYEQWIRNCEAAWDSPVGVYGGFYAIRRELANRIPAGTILDDMFQPLAIIRQGYRSVIDEKAVVYDTWPKKAAGEFHRKVRTLAGNFQLFRLAPWVLTWKNRVAFQLISHKVMRLIVPYLLSLLLVSACQLSRGSAMYAAFAAFAVATLALAVASLRYSIPFAQRIGGAASAMLVLNAAAVVGLYKFLFTQGPLWKIWGVSQSGDARRDQAVEVRV